MDWHVDPIKATGDIISNKSQERDVKEHGLGSAVFPNDGVYTGN